MFLFKLYITGNQSPLSNCILLKCTQLQTPILTGGGLLRYDSCHSLPLIAQDQNLHTNCHAAAGAATKPPIHPIPRIPFRVRRRAVRESPLMMSASEEGGSWKSGCIEVGCDNFIAGIYQFQMRTRGRGSKNTRFLWTSLMKAP